MIGDVERWCSAATGVFAYAWSVQISRPRLRRRTLQGVPPVVRGTRSRAGDGGGGGHGRCGEGAQLRLMSSQLVKLLVAVDARIARACVRRV